MEFLMTYGWAILVVLAAIGALAYFGVLSPSRFLPNDCIIQGGFSCKDYKVDGTANQVRFKVINNLGVDAKTVNVSMSTTDCTLTNSNVALGQMNNRDEKQVTFNCTAGTLSGSFRGNINVTYIKSGDSESHVASGQLTGSVE